MICKKAYLIALSIIVVTKFVIHAYILLRAPLLPGLDGGYYAVQVRSILINGKLYYSAPPITFYIFALFAQVLLALGYGPLNICVIDGIKLGLSAMVALSGVPAYLFAYELFKRRDIAIYFTLILLWHPYFIIISGGASLYKNSVGVFFLFSYLYFLFRSIDEIDSRVHILTIIFFVLNALTHILIFGIALALTLVINIIYVFLWRIKGLPLNNRFIKTIIANYILVIFAFVAIILFFPEFFGTYYKFESFIERFPFEFIPLILPIILFGFDLIVVITWLLILATAYELIFRRKHFLSKNKAPLLMILIAMEVLAIFLLWPFFESQYRIRFLFVSFIPFTVLSSFNISNLLKKKGEALVAFLAIMLIFTPAILRNYSHTFPCISFAETQDILVMRQYVEKENSIVYTRPGLHYWVTWFLDVPSDYHLNKENLENAKESYKYVYVILPKLVRNVHPWWKLIFRGSSLSLYLVT